MQMKVTGKFFSHRVLLDPLLQLRLRDVVSLDVVGDQVLVRQRLGVADGLQLEDELPEVELHQRAALVAALLRAREPESLNGLEKLQGFIPIGNIDFHSASLKWLQL